MTFDFLIFDLRLWTINPTRWARISEIVQQTFEKTDALTRSAYLTKICSVEPELSQEIES